MVTLAQLSNEVYILTNRPDLVAETRVAVRKAIMKFHSADTFKRDLKVTRLQMSTYPKTAVDQFRWSILLSEFGGQFRRPKSLIYPPELSPPTFVPAPLLDISVGISWQREYTEVTQDTIFDRYSAERLNYYYIAGNSLTIKSAFDVDYLDFWYYVYPVYNYLPNGDYTVGSWIVDQYPDAIIEEAAGTVFKMIGKDDEHNRYAQLFAENIAIVRMTDVGENA